jgi:predicted outer membrane repeat protein
MKLKNNIMILALFSLVLMFSLSMISAAEIESVDNITADDALAISEDEKISINDTQEETGVGNTIYISPTGTGAGSSESDPTNWNNALYSAQSGDTIQFLNGNYTGINNVHQQITKSVTLKGSGYSIIDAQIDGGFFTVSYGASVTLQNLSFVNAYTGKHYDGPDGSDAPFDGEGGIINNGELTVIDCLFDYNKGYGTEGGAIHNNGKCTVYNSTFSRNSGKKGASIYCEESAHLNIYNCSFTGGFSKNGNDIYADKNAVVTIHNSIMGNAYGKTGLIVIKKSYLYMYDTIISGARSIDTAGVINVDKESTVEIYRCIFDKNSATGGTLLFNEKNEMGDGDGGAIVIEKDARNVIIKDCVFKNNVAKNRGGAIYVESNTAITIDNCTFFNNQAGYGDNIYCYRYANRLTITNSKFEVKSTIQTEDIELGQTENIKVTVDDGTNGILSPKYSILVDGESYDVNNMGAVSIPCLSVGNHTAYLAAGDYNSNEFNFTQPSALFIVGGQDLEVAVSYSFNEDGSMNVHVIDEYGRPVSNKEITVTIDGIQYKSTTGNDGIAEIAPSLEVGNHNISVSVPGKVISDSTPTTIYVQNSTETPITQEVDVIFSYNDDGTINVEVKDMYNRVVANANVKVIINGITYSASTNSQGIAVINPDKNVAGEYDVKVEVKGKTVSPTSPSTIRVLPSAGISSIVSTNLIRAANSIYDFKARFLDKNSNPLKKKYVMFILNGNEYEVLTDEFGYAIFKNSLVPGSYEITSFNPSTNENVTNNLTIVNRIANNGNVNVDYSYSATYAVRLYGDNGKVVGSGEKVVFKIDGKNAKTVLTDKNGYAKLVIKDNSLLAKTHTISAEYKGVKVSNKLVVKQILKSQNKKYKRYGLKTFQATLKTSSGKAIKGKVITFKIKGKTYKAKTNKNGVAKIKIKNLNKVGMYKIKISYLKTSIKKTVTVKR